MLIRSIAERLSRRIVLKRVLPEKAGAFPIYVSPGSSLRYWRDFNSMDDALFDWAIEFVKPGLKVWDIGASVGLFTFAAAFKAEKTGRILAVEPDPMHVKLLERSRTHLPERSATVEIFAGAAADHDGESVLCIAQRSRNANYLIENRGSTQSGGSRQQLSVKTARLDTLSQQYWSPDIVKIDVEGGEYGVLSSGENLLTTIRPIIMCEVSGENRKQVTALLKSKKYKLFDLDAEGERPEISTAAWNTLAIP